MNSSYYYKLIKTNNLFIDSTKMVTSKYFFLQISLSILLLSISLSSAHDKPGDSPPPKPSIPVSSNPPPPSTPGTSNPPEPSSQASSSSGISYSSSGNSSFQGAFSKVYAFGDSFTDTGNAYLMGNLKSSFIGSLLSHAFKSLNSSQLSGNRQSNGRLVVDYLCDSLSIPHLPPYQQTKSNFSNGCNFAIAGSTSLSNDFFNKLKNHHGLNLMFKGIPLGFQTQLDWFHKFLQDTECQGKDENACKADMENALFWIGGMGRNDYARTFGTGSTFNIPRLKELTVAHISMFLQTLIQKGAKYIVVQGLPPVGCCPLELQLTKSSDRDQLGCAAAINGMIKAHNELLQKMLADFQAKNSQCTIVYADYWNAFKTILENHKKFNFEEPFKTCCGSGGGELNFNMQSTCGMLGTSSCKDPSRYINWDGVHFTEAMHKQVADLFLHKGFCKPSFDQVIKMKLGMMKAGMAKAGMMKAGMAKLGMMKAGMAKLGVTKTGLGSIGIGSAGMGSIGGAGAGSAGVGGTGSAGVGGSWSAGGAGVGSAGSGGVGGAGGTGVGSLGSGGVGGTGSTGVGSAGSGGVGGTGVGSAGSAGVGGAGVGSTGRTDVENAGVGNADMGLAGMVNAGIGKGGIGQAGMVKGGIGHSGMAKGGIGQSGMAKVGLQK